MGIENIMSKAVVINPATKYVVLSASNRTRIKARLAGNGKPLSKAATPVRVLFEAPDQLIMLRKAALSARVGCVINTCCRMTTATY